MEERDDTLRVPTVGEITGALSVMMEFERSWFATELLTQIRSMLRRFRMFQASRSHDEETDSDSDSGSDSCSDTEPEPGSGTKAESDTGRPEEEDKHSMDDAALDPDHCFDTDSDSECS